jgi:hypothetical protein
MRRRLVFSFSSSSSGAFRLSMMQLFYQNLSMLCGTVTTFLCKSTDAGSTIIIIISLIAIVAANKRILRPCENFNYA